jgi:mannosyltransferase OCH1-like enzyme
MDYECIQALDVLLTGSTCCMGMEPTVNSKIYKKRLIIGNALMASTPKHPYMAAIIEDMKTNFSVDYKTIESFQILESTGPFMVTRVYERFLKKKSVTLLPADLVTPLSIKEVFMLRTAHLHPDVLKKIENAFAIHYFFGSWTEQTAEGKRQVKK